MTLTLVDLERIYSLAWFQSYQYDSIEDAKTRRLERHRAALEAVRAALFDSLVDDAEQEDAAVAAWLRRVAAQPADSADADIS
jgi:hypothetical protein